MNEANLETLSKKAHNPRAKKKQPFQPVLFEKIKFSRKKTRTKKTENVATTASLSNLHN